MLESYCPAGNYAIAIRAVSDQLAFRGILEKKGILRCQTIDVVIRKRVIIKELNEVVFVTFLFEAPRSNQLTERSHIDIIEHVFINLFKGSVSNDKRTNLTLCF